MKKLFCIPGAGASAVMFLPWMKETKDIPDFKLVMLEIPGRGMRKNDKALTTMDELTEALLKKMDIMLEEGDTYALYGYCFGAIIAYEMCRKIKQRKLKQPESLFISSIGAPGNAKIARPVFANMSMRKEIVQMFSHYFPEQMFESKESLNRVSQSFTKKVYEKFDQTGEIQKVEAKELKLDAGMIDESSREYQRMIEFANETLGVFAYDQDMLIDYANEEKENFIMDIPVYAIRGEEDTLTSSEDIQEWKQYTGREFIGSNIKGNHFSFEESKDEIIQYIFSIFLNPEKIEIIDI